MRFILGKKLEMSQLFDQDGNVVPVTLVEAGPCLVTQVKNQEKDGYAAVQIGFGYKKKLSKPLKGHLKGLDNFRWIREFRLTETLKHLNTEMFSNLKRGDEVTVDIFSEGEVIKISGTSKGKGFQGVVKRHGFHGHPKTHGHKDQERMPGSIGSGGMQRVMPGLRMAGHMGAERVTVKNLEIVKIDLENNVLYVKGAVPGHRGSLVEIVGEGEMKVKHTNNDANKNEYHANMENTENIKTQEIQKQETNN